jgi:hypothetical protein
MSRTRIVKGTYTKISHSGHNMYSNESIITTAGKEVTETGVKKGVSYGNPEDPPKPEIKAKCIVMFRPHGNWSGEFGFDWFRGGDSGLNSDPNWFGKIVGKHYTDGTYRTLWSDTNFWSSFFKQDWKMYDNILRSYKSYIVPWKKKIRGNSYLYPIPIMTMLKGEKHKLTLKIEIKEKPKKLTIIQKKKNENDANYFTFNVTNLPIKNGIYNLNSFLEITCTNSFKKDQIIEILADDEPCGWLKILANDPSHFRYIPIVIVKVKTAKGTGDIVAGGEVFFKQGLKQSYSFPKNNRIEKVLELNIISSTFDSEYTDGRGNINSSNGNRNRKSMLQFLDEQLESRFPKRYTNHYKLYFLANQYPTTVNGQTGYQISGFSNFKTLHGVYFRGHGKSVVTHETLHAIGLPHTFDGISTEAKFTYKAQQTDNLMDYCDWSSDGYGNPHKAVDGVSLFRWQMIVINPNLKDTN